MDFKDKIEIIIKERNISQKDFADIINVNHVVFNRNVNNNNLTGDIIKGVAKYTDIDLNWFVRDLGNENREIHINHNTMALDKINEMMKILNELKDSINE